MDRETLPVVCAWCREGMPDSPGVRVSHGICPDCARDFLRRLPPAYLRSIAGPDGTVTLFSGCSLPIE
ncbi:hypothetical protein [Tepidiforma sp.]|uniref:hypothetical protein n=1 Tax=Tepidiforma sp. TaxID=2682230 RepID=UPI002ADDDAF2|nr:hypothetical protein [Tepidiforma sp.]